MDTPRIQDEIPTLKAAIKAPYVGANLSTLGGVERATIMIVVSLDPREQWQNGILENSQYFRMSFGSDGELNMFSGGVCGKKKFRKTRAKNVGEAVTKINKYLDYLNERP